MQRKQFTFTNTAGDTVALASVDVFLAGTLTRAELWENRNGTGFKPNPFFTDVRGQLAFYTADGRYDIVITAQSGLQVKILDEQVLDIVSAISAADAGGLKNIYATKALMDAAVGSHVNGDVVEVLIDETQANARTRYRRESGVFVFKVNLDSTRSELSKLYAVESVAGTGAAYTGTASDAPAAGRVYRFTPHVTNTGVATLAINGGAARSIRDEGGTQLLSSMLIAGRQYLLVFQSDNTYRVTGARRTLDARGAVNQVGDDAGLFYNAFKNPTDAHPVSRLFYAADGSIDVYAGGSGASAAPLVARFLADGSLRSFGRVLNAANLEFFHPTNQPDLLVASSGGIDAARVLFNLPIDRDDKATQPLSVLSTEPVLVTGAHRNGIDINIANAFLDCQCMPRGVPVPLHVSPSGSVSIYSGPAFTWAGYANDQKTLALPANAVAVIHRIRSSVLVLQVITGAATPSTANPPVRASAVALGISQSNGKGLISRGGFRGFQEGLEELGRSRNVWPIDGSFGGSSILRGNSEGADNYWWNQDTGSAGPLVAQSVAAITAAAALGQPAPLMTYGIIGETDAAFMTSAGVTTPTSWKNALVSTIAAYRSALGSATHKILLSPLGSQDNVGFSAGGYNAIREALIEIALADANVRVGPELYDVSRRYEEVHIDYQGSRELGRRLARHWDNWINGTTHSLGPRIVGFTPLTSTTFRIDIDAGGEGLVRPEFPAGFALIPTPGSVNAIVDAVPFKIVRTQWGFTDPLYTLTVTTSVAATGCRLAYPWGTVPDIRTGRWVRGLTSGLPLRSYRP